jgi:hypothetical protein
MGIPKLPTYTFPNNNAKLMTILSVAAQAQEIAAIIAPFVNRPVSWRNVSDAAFRSVNLLESNGLISNEITTALSDSIRQVNQIQTTTNTLQSVTSNLTTSNFQQSLFTIDSITSTLAQQSASLNRTSDYWVDVVNSNRGSITTSNTPDQSQDSIDTMNEYIRNNTLDIANSLSSMNFLASTLNSFGVDATGVITNTNAALNVVNDVANTAASVANIANNIQSSINNVKNIVNNIKKIDSIFEKKRKGNKKIPTIPASIDPRNSQYYTLYKSINTTIDTLNSASTSLTSIPKIPFLS